MDKLTDKQIKYVLDLMAKMSELKDKISSLKADAENIEFYKDHIRDLKNPNRLDFSWVAIWRESKLYGGAEEGGWYFDHDELVNKPFQIPDDLQVNIEKWFLVEYGSSQNKDIVMSDEAYTREIELYGELLEPIRGEATSTGKYKITFHKEYPQEAPYPVYE
tara:strand:- start:189 stop:674 length:486 start_codon:yes stop_codon:yes gene_type:complete